MVVYIVLRRWHEGVDIDSVHHSEDAANDRASYINIGVALGNMGGLGATVEKHEVQ